MDDAMLDSGTTTLDSTSQAVGLALGAIANSTIGAPLLEEIGNEVDLDACRLLGPVGLVAQAIMGTIVLSGLVVKRMREHPRRKWKTWLADVAKQVVGQLFLHASNVLIADLIASATSVNPCSLYAAQILIDTTFGVLLIYYLLAFATHLMRAHVAPEYQQGFYGHPHFSWHKWGEQAAVYIACLAAMKAVVVFFMWAFPLLEDGVSWLLSWIPSDEAQVVLVMLVLPLVMNLFQFLMVDSFLKSHEPSSALADLAGNDEEALRRGFLDGHTSDDDDDDDERSHAHSRSSKPTSQRSGGPGSSTKDDGDDHEARALLALEEGGDSPALPRRLSHAPTSAPEYVLHNADDAHDEDEDDTWADGWDGSDAASSHGGGERGRHGGLLNGDEDDDVHVPRESTPALGGGGSGVRGGPSAFAQKAIPLVDLSGSAAARAAPAPAPPVPVRTSSTGPVHVREPSIDDWGFGAEGEPEAEPSFFSSFAAPPPSTAPPPPQPQSTSAPSPFHAPARAPSPPRSSPPLFAPRAPSPTHASPAAADDDDWGFSRPFISSDDVRHAARDAAEGAATPVPRSSTPLASAAAPALALGATAAAAAAAVDTARGDESAVEREPEAELAAEEVDEWGFDADAEVEGEADEHEPAPAPPSPPSAFEPVLVPARAPSPPPAAAPVDLNRAPSPTTSSGEPAAEADDWGFDGEEHGEELEQGHQPEPVELHDDASPLAARTAADADADAPPSPPSPPPRSPSPPLQHASLPPPPPPAAPSSDADAEEPAEVEVDSRDAQEDSAAVLSEAEDLDELGDAEEASEGGSSREAEASAEVLEPVEEQEQVVEQTAGAPAEPHDDEPSLVSSEQEPAVAVAAAAPPGAAVEEEDDDWGFDGDGEPAEPVEEQEGPPVGVEDDGVSALEPVAERGAEAASVEQEERAHEPPSLVDLDDSPASVEPLSAPPPAPEPLVDLVLGVERPATPPSPPLDSTLATSPTRSSLHALLAPADADTAAATSPPVELDDLTSSAPVAADEPAPLVVDLLDDDSTDPPPPTAAAATTAASAAAVPPAPTDEVEEDEADDWGLSGGEPSEGDEEGPSAAPSSAAPAPALAAALEAAAEPAASSASPEPVTSSEDAAAPALEPAVPEVEPAVEPLVDAPAPAAHDAHDDEDDDDEWGFDDSPSLTEVHVPPVPSLVAKLGAAPASDVRPVEVAGPAAAGDEREWDEKVVREEEGESLI
ncbi:hypothetical protein JCM8208_003817 [Rhodotorula glutinis]